MAGVRRLWNVCLTLVLAPGIVSHEFAHTLACRLFGVELRGTRVLDPFAADAYIDHEPIDSFTADIAIALSPLLLNTILGVGAFFVGTVIHYWLLDYPLLWLGACFALTAFPSHSDTTTLLRTVRSLPIWIRPLGYLLAVPLRLFSRIPGVQGVAGYLWIFVCYALGTTIHA